MVHQHLSFLFGAGQESSYQLTDFVGIERSLVSVSESGVKQLYVHQTKYASFVVASYQDEYCGGKELRSISTPCPCSELKEPPEPLSSVASWLVLPPDHGPSSPRRPGPPGVPLFGPASRRRGSHAAVLSSRRRAG